MTDISHADLLSRLRYDPDTGQFTWLKCGRSDLIGRAAGTPTDGGNGLKYSVIKIDLVPYKAHRLAWFYVTGEWPSASIDHRDRDGLNNAWANLRAATHSQNHGNRKCQRSSLTGIKGVQRRGTKYIARIRDVYLGRFDNPIDASAAYLKAAQESFGEFARAG